MNERPSYVEQTWAPAWVLVLLWVSCLVGAVTLIYGTYVQGSLGHPFGQEPAPTWLLGGSAALCFFIPLAITLIACRLEVEIRRDSMHVAFGPVRLIRRTLGYDEITSIEAVTYRPIRDFGGWGIRFRPGKTAWTVRGNRAVRLTLASGKDFYIGSRFPHRLAERIQVAKRLRESGNSP